MIARSLCAAALACSFALASVVQAQDAASGADSPAMGGVYARVIVDSTALRSGPGSGFRRVYVAHRGDVFPIRERSTEGYWFRLELPDGTFAWVLGEAVYNHTVTAAEANRGRFLPELFAPPALLNASGEVAFNFGYMSPGGGFMAIRPSILVHPTFGLELGAAAFVSAAGRILMGTGGGIVNVFPDEPIVPFIVAGGGVAFSDPNADSFVLASGATAVLYGGGGLRIGFRHRITLRLEVRIHAFYTPNRYVTQEEYSGGLTVFF